jgi:hypothetical protein
MGVWVLGAVVRGQVHTRSGGSPRHPHQPRGNTLCSVQICSLVQQKPLGCMIALNVCAVMHTSRVSWPSIFLPRNRLAPLEPYSITLAYAPHVFSVVPPFSTPLDPTRRHSRVGHTARRPSTRLVLDSPTRVHHCVCG